jgi:thioredoxin 1
MGFFEKLFRRQPKPGKPRPVTDSTFEQDVLASDLPAVVDFWSSKCPPCHVMKGLLEEVGPEYAGRVNIFKLNVDQNPNTAMKYQIMSVPTLIFFRRGQAKETISGLIALHPLRQKLDRLAA